jgi:uncharacterized protein YprB with RNaseH-like and TPR domain
MYEARILRVERDPYIMCFAYKWADEDETHVVSQPDFKAFYKKHPHDDYQVVSALRELMDEADIVVAHNGNKFDNRVATERFLFHGLTPPSPYKSVDTLLIARRYFKNNYNTLDALCTKLGIGCKSEVRHSDVWHDCVQGDMDAWNLMVEYNKNDILMLEGLYHKLRPFISNHPNLANFGQPDVCPKCGSAKMQYRGIQRSNVAVYRRVHCQDCGAWSRERIAQRAGIERPNMTNIS